MDHDGHAKYLHTFAVLPAQFHIAFPNGQSMDVPSSVPVELKQGTCLVATGSRDVPFERACALVPNSRIAWTGCSELDPLLKSWNHQCVGTQLVTFVSEERPPAAMSIPVIQGEIAFLAALDIAIEQYGGTMDDGLKTALHSFIVVEKNRHNITS